MTRYIIPIAILIALAGLSSGTIWLYTDPMFFSGLPSSTTPYSFGYPSGSIGSFKPFELSPFEIVNSPFFSMLGHGFSINTTSEKNQTNKPVVSIGGAGSLGIPPQMTFSGGLENNLKYAESKSSLRVGQGGSWTTLNTPWLI